MSQKVWAMIKVDLHNDRRIQDIACEYGPRALAYWLVLILESKKVHRSNDGWAGPFTWQQLSCMCYDEKAKRKTVEDLLSAFVNSGLLELDNSSLGSRKVHASTALGRFYTRPSKFLALQQTAAATTRKQKSRSNLQGKSDSSHETVTPDVTEESQQSHTYNYNYNYKDNNKEKSNKKETETATEKETEVSTDLDRIATANRSSILSVQVQTIFEHWVKTDQETGGGNLPRKLNSSRKQKIKARLNEGYSVEQICGAITAFCNTPFYQGENDRNTRYTDLITLLKNGEQVERGLQLGFRPERERVLTVEEKIAARLANPGSRGVA